jgi:isopenicillin N synthase-like dioxygenase
VLIDLHDHDPAEVDRLLGHGGFLLVTNHGVEPDLATDLRTAAASFFALPVEVKERYATGVLARGWVPYGREANAYSSGTPTPPDMPTLPDMKESFTFGSDVLPPGMPPELDALYGPNQWPDEVPALLAAGRAWIGAVHMFRDAMLEVFATALGLDPTWFGRAMRHPVWQVNVNWYPPAGAIGPAADGQFRIGPHTDFGVLTVLDRQPGHGGLQVQATDGTWSDAPFHPDALTVNLGDLFAKWTAGRWLSAVHRVLPPPVDREESLLSLICFVEGDADFLVTPFEPPIGAGIDVGTPIRAGDHLLNQLRAIDVVA